MKLMEDRISQDAIIEDGEILKVGSFLNQQIDVPSSAAVRRNFTGCSARKASPGY